MRAESKNMTQSEKQKRAVSNDTLSARIPTKTATHPFKQIEIVFDESTHSYIDFSNGRRYISVTTFIDQFFPKFDTAGVAAKVAEKRGVKPEKLIDEWRAEAARGRREGTHVHNYAEALITGCDDWRAPENVREARLYRQVARAVVSLLKMFEFVAAEQIVFSPELGIAGMVDLIMADRQTGEIIILDWKQNKAIDRDSAWNEKALPPIEHLDNCDLSKYSLQLGLYYRIIRDEMYYVESGCHTGFYRAALIHLTEDSYRPMRLRDPMENELDDMLGAI